MCSAAEAPANQQVSERPVRAQTAKTKHRPALTVEKPFQHLQRFFAVGVLFFAVGVRVCSLLLLEQGGAFFAVGAGGGAFLLLVRCLAKQTHPKQNLAQIAKESTPHRTNRKNTNSENHRLFLRRPL